MAWEGDIDKVVMTLQNNPMTFVSFNLIPVILWTIGFWYFLRKHVSLPGSSILLLGAGLLSALALPGWHYIMGLAGGGMLLIGLIERKRWILTILAVAGFALFYFVGLGALASIKL